MLCIYIPKAWSLIPSLKKTWKRKGGNLHQALNPLGGGITTGNRKVHHSSGEVAHWWPLMEWKHRHIISRVKSIQSKWITGVSLPDQYRALLWRSQWCVLRHEIGASSRKAAEKTAFWTPEMWLLSPGKKEKKVNASSSHHGEEEKKPAPCSLNICPQAKCANRT